MFFLSQVYYIFVLLADWFGEFGEDKLVISKESFLVKVAGGAFKAMNKKGKLTDVETAEKDGLKIEMPIEPDFRGAYLYTESKNPCFTVSGKFYGRSPEIVPILMSTIQKGVMVREGVHTIIMEANNKSCIDNLQVQGDPWIMTGTYAGYCVCVLLFLFISLAQGYSNGIYITRQHVGDTEAKTITERYCGCFAKIFTTKCFMALAALFGLLFHVFDLFNDLIYSSQVPIFDNFVRLGLIGCIINPHFMILEHAIKKSRGLFGTIIVFWVYSTNSQEFLKFIGCCKFITDSVATEYQ